VREVAHVRPILLRHATPSLPARGLQRCCSSSSESPEVPKPPKIGFVPKQVVVKNYSIRPLTKGRCEHATVHRSASHYPLLRPRQPPVTPNAKAYIFVLVGRMHVQTTWTSPSRGPAAPGVRT
jgi:hypothetical protein